MNPAPPPAGQQPAAPSAAPGQFPLAAGRVPGETFQLFANPMEEIRRNRPVITDPNIDQSVRNSAIGDGYSGERGGFLYAGGQRMMPSTGNAAQDQATLHQFGVRTPENAAAYNGAVAQAGQGAMPMGGGAAKPMAAAGTPDLQSMIARLQQGNSPQGAGANPVVNALMRRFRPQLW